LLLPLPALLFVIPQRSEGLCHCPCSITIPITPPPK
jgi:hypothetical protein